jgi:hypothetical protein
MRVVTGSMLSHFDWYSQSKRWASSRDSGQPGGAHLRARQHLIVAEIDPRLRVLEVDLAASVLIRAQSEGSTLRYVVSHTTRHTNLRIIREYQMKKRKVTGRADRTCLSAFDRQSLSSGRFA